MKSMTRLNKYALPLMVAALVLSAYTVLGINWNIDPNYSIKFSGKKAEGTLSGLTGNILFDKNDLANSKIDVTVDANTIKTGNSLKDSHAKDDSWFDATKYPKIRFTSSNFSKQGDKFLVTGILELHGTKKQVSIPFSYSENGDKAAFTGSFKVNRKDYGIKGNMFGFVVGDDFDVTLNVPVSRK